MLDQKPKGSVMLKVTGILYIVFGAIAALLSLSFFSVTVMMPYIGEELSTEIDNILSEYEAIQNILQTAEVVEFVDYIFLAMGIVSAVLAILGIITGIINLVNSSKPQNYKVCMAFSIIFLVIALLTTAVSMDLITLVACVVIPIISIIGAVFNKQSLLEQQIGSRYRP